MFLTYPVKTIACFIYKERVMQDIVINVQRMEGIIAGGVLILTFMALWKSTHMTSLIKKGWEKTLGRHQHVMMTKINILLAEMAPNGGGSIRDALNRIEDRQENLIALNGARLDADHQAIILTNAQGKVIKISRAFQELTGMSIEQMEGDGWINIIYPEDREEVLEQWRQVIEGKREMNAIQRYQNKYGEPYSVVIKVYRQFDSQKVLRGYLAVVTPADKNKLCPFFEDTTMCSEACNRDVCRKNNRNENV